MVGLVVVVPVFVGIVMMVMHGRNNSSGRR